jgi:hypothetical protein
MWVLLDETNGAQCGDGSVLDHATLVRIAAACESQLNREFAAFYGGAGLYYVRAGESSTDIQPGEQVYSFVPTLAQAPGASAYHDTDGKGVPVAYCAVTTCSSLLGPSGISVDCSHELLEAAADPSCNLMADNLAGLLVAYEVCDPVEVQTYPSYVDDKVQVSNFVLPSWFDPKASAPYDFMTEAKLDGAVAPPGPLQIAPGNGGNYVITETSTENSTDTFGIKGNQRKARRDTGSRFMRRMMGRQVSMRGRMQIGGASPAPAIPVKHLMVTPGNGKLTPAQSAQAVAQAAHTPPGTVERVAAHKTPPAQRPPGRPVPVSLQRLTVLGGTIPVPDDAIGPSVGAPTELSAAGVNAAQKFLTRADTRGSRPQGQFDPQQSVLAGRRVIREKLGPQK